MFGCVGGWKVTTRVRMKFLPTHASCIPWIHALEIVFCERDFPGIHSLLVQKSFSINDFYFKRPPLVWACSCFLTCSYSWSHLLLNTCIWHTIWTWKWHTIWTCKCHTIWTCKCHTIRKCKCHMISICKCLTISICKCHIIWMCACHITWRCKCHIIWIYKHEMRPHN